MERLQAPKGGCISEENRERYEGGQFLPSTCLPKGSLSKARKAAKIPKNIAEIIAERKTVYVIYAGSQSRAWMHSADSHEDAAAFARFVVAERNAILQKSGFMAHPTIITIKP
jgi:hypothetical protein